MTNREWITIEEAKKRWPRGDDEMTDIPGLIERLRFYETVWGDEPSISPHPRTSPGFTTGRVIGDAKEAADALSRLSEDKKRLEEALTGLLTRYKSLADSGDCGFWDCEEEPEVIAARSALRGE